MSRTARRRGTVPSHHARNGLTALPGHPTVPRVIAAFVTGAVAGFGIAIPVGAIGILIIETGLRRGFRMAASAGAGAASADGLYAMIAAAFGTALAGTIAPLETPLRILAAGLLLAIALRGLWGLRGTRTAVPDSAAAMLPDVEAAERTGSARRTYGFFLGITLLNPVTVTYFAALIIGLTTTGTGPWEKAAFVAGAFLASLSWQTLLAGGGAFLRQRLSPRLRTAVVVLGNGIILLFAASIAVSLIA